MTSRRIASDTIHQLLGSTNSSVGSLVALYRTSVADGGRIHGRQFLSGFGVIHRGLMSLRSHSCGQLLRPYVSNGRVVRVFRLGPYHRMNMLGRCLGSTILSGGITGRHRPLVRLLVGGTRSVKLGVTRGLGERWFLLGGNSRKTIVHLLFMVLRHFLGLGTLFRFPSRNNVCGGM